MVAGRARADWVGLLEGCPKSREALARPRPEGWLPVFVSRVQFAGIRWISLMVEPDAATRPEGVTETKVGATLYAVD